MHVRTCPFILYAVIALAIISAACAGPETTREEPPAATPSPSISNQEASATPAAPVPEATPAAPAPKPAPSEVRDALARIYKGAVAFDERGGRAVVGDFNGDGSQDLAAEVQPAAGKVSELNDELANWIVADPRQVKPLDPGRLNPHQGVQTSTPGERPLVQQRDTLLVVIHGFKEEGWRNPNAMQTYLLKNAADGGELKAEARAGAQTVVQKTILRLQGDVILEKLGGESGFLYWTGASYGWFH
jgi:hypothetical protein